MAIGLGGERTLSSGFTFLLTSQVSLFKKSEVGEIPFAGIVVGFR